MTTKEARVEPDGRGRYYIIGPDGKRYGYIANRIFYKPWNNSLYHKFLKLNCWALDADSYDKLVRPTCLGIMITDNKTGINYYAAIETFETWKGEFHYPGYGRQYFMTEEHWTTGKGR